MLFGNRGLALLGALSLTEAAPSGGTGDRAVILGQYFNLQGGRVQTKEQKKRTECAARYKALGWSSTQIDVMCGKGSSTRKHRNRYKNNPRTVEITIKGEMKCPAKQICYVGGVKGRCPCDEERGSVIIDRLKVSAASDPLNREDGFAGMMVWNIGSYPIKNLAVPEIIYPGFIYYKNVANAANHKFLAKGFFLEADGTPMLPIVLNEKHKFLASAWSIRAGSGTLRPNSGTYNSVVTASGDSTRQMSPVAFKLLFLGLQHHLDLVAKYGDSMKYGQSMRLRRLPWHKAIEYNHMFDKENLTPNDDLVLDYHDGKTLQADGKTWA